MKKRLLSLALASLMAVGMVAVTGCSNNSNSQTAQATQDAQADSTAAADATTGDKDVKIGIIQMIENGAFNDMRQGIIDELTANGYDEADIDYQCAQGDSSSLQTIATAMADGSYDVVFTIATPATQAFVNLEATTPCFYCAVSAPVAAGVISDMDTPDKNATGTSNAIPVSDIFALCNELTPDVQTYGFLYCTSEDNSVNTANAAKEYCDANGIAYEEISITNSSEVEVAVETLCDKVDAIFVPNDATVQSAFEIVTETTREKGIPVYASSATTVQSGAFATIAISDLEIGKLTADMAREYLEDGKAVTDIPSVVVPASATVVNEDTMNALGLTLDGVDDITFVKDAE